jgi:hypothetical protein
MPSKTEEQEFQKISCKIPRRLWREGKILAMDENVDFQDIVVRALEAYLQAPAKRGKEGR